jgi:N-acetylglucosamine-6-phosphate deacetylase
MTSHYLISGPAILYQGAFLENASLEIKNGRFQKLYSAGEALPDIPHQNFPKTYHLLPGMIDLHIHGTQGKDVMDGSIDALQTIADTLLKSGTTSFLATTMTADESTLTQVLDNIAAFKKQQTTGATLLGVHLEGPFIAQKFMGAQKPDHMILPSNALFDRLQKASGNLIKMVTIAPELEGALTLIDHLKSSGVCISLGHSAATYDIAQKAIDHGVTHATHLFNAMKPLHHREPGAVTALLLREEVYTELIIDGHHLHPAIVNVVLRLKTPARITLVTDAMRAQCLCEGHYELGGQPVIVAKDKSARLENGALAGSIITQNEALQNFMAITGMPLEKAFRLVSQNPAAEMGLLDRGLILPGYRADFMVMDENNNIHKTVVEGRF